MPASKPRKSRKRTREIREQSRATGAKYTQTMRENDRVRAADFEWPPAGTLQSPYAYGGDSGQRSSGRGRWPPRSGT